MKKLKQIGSKIVVLIVVVYVLFSYFLSGISLANIDDYSQHLTAERAGNYVANFAINFYNNFANKVNYADSVEVGYAGQTYKGVAHSDQYYMDNLDWIAFVYNNCLKFEEGELKEEFSRTNYIYSEDNTKPIMNSHYIFEELNFENYNNAFIEDEQNEGVNINIIDLATDDTIHPGDIIVTAEKNEDNTYDKKVYLYIGAGQVIFCEEQLDENGQPIEKQSPLQLSYIEQMDFKARQVLRITEDAAKEIIDTDVTMIFAGKGYDSGITYEGMPKEGTYIGTIRLGDYIMWIVDMLSHILDYLVGIFLYIIKAIIIGWVNLIENLVHSTILGSKDKVDGAYVNSLTGESNNLGYRVSIEDIIYNRIPIFDVNFFNFKVAGGSEISEDSIIYLLRQNIAGWYYIVRNVSIVIMLFVLIYIGIRIALSVSSPEEKAKYKKSLMNWIVGFVAIIFIHLFMYLVLIINENLVKLFEQVGQNVAGGEMSLYETIRTKSYSLRFTEGTAGVILYVVLVWVLIQFCMAYFKRYLTVTILAIIGPIMGIKYAIEGATGRKTKSIANWMMEFILNVFIQTVHALVYTALMSIVIEFAFMSLSGFVMALIIMNFMLKADKIFMKIFKFERSGTAGESARPESVVAQFAMFKVGSRLFGKTVRGGASLVTGTVGTYQKAMDTFYGREPGTTKDMMTKQVYQSVGHRAMAIKGNRYEKLNKIKRQIDASNSDKQAKKLEKKKEKLETKLTQPNIVNTLSLLKGTKESEKLDKVALSLLKNQTSLYGKSFSRALKGGVAPISRMYKTIGGIPIGVANDALAGGMVLLSGVKGSLNTTDRVSIRNIKWNDNDLTNVQKVKNTALNAITMGGVGDYYSTIYDLDRIDKKIEKNYHKMEDLQTAAFSEAKLELLYNELQKENPDKTKEEIDKEFYKVAKEADKNRVKKSDITAAIQQYMLSKKWANLSEVDVDEVINIIRSRVGGKVEFTNETRDNIKEELEKLINPEIEVQKVSKKQIQTAVEKGLNKKGSIRSEEIKGTTKSDIIKAEIQREIREYDLIRDTNKEGLKSVSTIVKEVKGKTDNK